MTGPLNGVRVVEFAGIGPGPFATMLLADLGADVIRIDRPAGGSAVASGARADAVNRGKRSIAIDVKSPAGQGVVRTLVRSADVVVEGFRPGVMERLGLGPADLMLDQPELIYGRMTGWGQDGPLSQVAGHDINYIALTGALWASGRADETPSAPLNLLGDYAGGSMFLVMGVLAALYEREQSGQGQIVDAAMVEGVSVLSTMFTALTAMGMWDPTRRGANPLDSGAPWYDVYECKDSKYMSVGALEPQFYAELVRLTEFGVEDGDSRFTQPGPSDWPLLKKRWAEHWLTRPRDEWAGLLQHTDACAQPVLDWSERLGHPHLQHRRAFEEVGGAVAPAPAPRLSRTAGRVGGIPPVPGEHTREISAEIGISAQDLASLIASDAVCCGRSSPKER
ncbi:MAG: CaiB/BaiF CoA transferase family protein [Aeromicrobium sp.]